MTLTVPDLKKLAPNGTPIILAAIAAHSLTALPKWHINTPKRLWMFLAMVKVESAGMSKVFEDMDYSAERAHEIYKSYFPTLAAAEPYAHNPQKLANKVYGNRLGNTGPNDGWYARGAGLLQVTGMTDYTKLAKIRGTTVDQTRADLTDSKAMLDCAAATFSGWGLLPYADKGDITGCTRALNGGLNGLVDREAAYALAKKVWPKG